MNGPEHIARLDLADMLEIIFQHPLLHGDLCRRFQMLHGAAAADAEVGAFGRHALRRFAMQGGHVGCFPIGFLAKRDEAHRLARQGAFDKNDLAGRAVFVLQMADAARIHVQRFDQKLWCRLHKKSSR